MDKKIGIVSQLLYQIRMKLEKKGTTIDANRNFKQGNQTATYSEMKIGRKMEMYDEFGEKFFRDTLGKRMKPQKEQDMQDHLYKFELFKINEETKIRKAKEAEEEKKEKDRFVKSQNEKGKAQRLHAFNQQFEQKGIEYWNKNITRKMEMEKKEIEFQLKEAKKYERIVQNSIKYSEMNTMNQIEDFEKYLKNHDVNAINQTETNIKKNPKAMESLDSAIEKIREKTLQNPNTKRERDRRRRKIIVEQGKAQTEIENRRREEQLISKLDKKSNQEKQLAYEFWRVDQNKKIIIENRKYREENYEERILKDKVINQENEEEFVRFHLNNFQRDMQKEDLRSKQLVINEKQKNRSTNTGNCREMIQLIIDIAEEAYIYQQTNDSEAIDDRVWREWMQLFINNQSALKQEEYSRLPDLNQTDNQIENQLKSYNNSTISLKSSKLNAGNESSMVPLSEMEEITCEKTLDECEFLDYLNYMGQWRRSLIPTTAFFTINLVELMTDPQQAAAVDPKAKKPPVGKGVEVKEEYKEDDPDNLIIPKEPNLNCYLGNLVDTLIDTAFEDAGEEPKRYLFTHIPIKISLIGHAFSGKKTQAKILSENFPFKIYKLEELITQAIEFSENIDKDINNTRSSNVSRISVLSHKNQNSIISPELRKISQNIKELLRQGEPIPDEIYVDLLIENIKNDYPEKSMEDISKETLARLRRKMEILEEIQELKDDEVDDGAIRSNEDLAALNEELMKINLDLNKGFVVVDFPNTYNQAKILEKKLSGYMPESEKPQTKAELLKCNASLILDKTPKNQPPRQLIKGGLDFVFLLEVPPSECIRRALGLRVDPATGQIYHLEDNPPPTTENFICERLRLVDDHANSLSSLVTRHLSFERLCGLVADFYEPFGFEKEKLKQFNTINGHKNKDLITQDLIDILNKLISIHENRDNELYKLEELRLKEEEDHDIIDGEKKNKEDHGDVSQSLILSRDGDNKSQISKTNNANGDKGKTGVTPHDQNSKPQNSVLGSNKNLQAIDDGHTDLVVSNNMIVGSNQIEDEELARYVQRLAEVKEKLSKELLEILLQLWFQVYDNYLKECKLIFRFLRKQRDFISDSFNTLQQKFIEFLKRPSKKQILLLDFQYNYNKFLDDFPDLIDDPAVKCEHHQSVDDLSDKIWEIIEQRKNEAIDERKRIMTSNWIENEMEKLYIHLERLFQAEIDKFTGSLQLIRDYYHGLDNRALLELPMFTVDIIKDEPDQTPLEAIEAESNSYPRVEKLYKTALKVQFLYDESIFKAERDKVAAQQEKESKEKKGKPADKGKNKNVVASESAPEEKKELYHFDDEMKMAIKFEKAKYR